MVTYTFSASHNGILRPLTQINILFLLSNSQIHLISPKCLLPSQLVPVTYQISQRTLDSKADFGCNSSIVQTITADMARDLVLEALVKE